jgi:hypothetical protein
VSADLTAAEAPHDTIRRAAKTQQGLIVDLLMALADEMADYPAVLVPNGVSIESQPNRPSPIWTAAYKFALVCLGEVADTP